MIANGYASFSPALSYTSAYSVFCARDSFNFEEKILLYQAIDDANCIGRKLFSFKIGWKNFITQTHESLDILRTNKIGCEFSNIIESDAETVQYDLHICKNLAKLNLEIVLTNHTTFLVYGELSRDENNIACFNVRSMTVRALSRGRERWIYIFDGTRHMLDLFGSGYISFMFTGQPVQLNNFICLVVSFTEAPKGC
jgi:hypothetical protein